MTASIKEKKNTTQLCPPYPSRPWPTFLGNADRRPLPLLAGANFLALGISLVLGVGTISLALGTILRLILMGRNLARPALATFL